jgi:GNAT superfamily N-acetyltransferase
MRLSLQHCQLDDIDQLTHFPFRLLARLPPDRLINLFYGPNAAQGQLASKANFTSRFADPTIVLLKVVDLDSPADFEVRGIDAETGEFNGEIRREVRILAISQWKVVPNYNPLTPPYGKELSDGGILITPEMMTHLPTQAEKDECAAVLNVWLERRRREQKEAHLHLALMIVDADFHRMGLGSMMADWGNRVADALGVACWLEASDMGKGLYEKHGYVHMKEKKWKLEGEGLGDGLAQWVMRRPPKPLPIVEVRSASKDESEKARIKAVVSEVVAPEI